MINNRHGKETPTTGSQIIVEQPVKVLLVDDRPDKLIALESILADPAIELVLAHSGKEALRLVLAHDFAVILLDVSMPIMDGFETASLIRQRKSSEHTPIIFITAYSDTEMPASRGYSLGAVDYIFAPVNPDILRAKVSVFIELFKKAREAQRQGEWLRKLAERRASTLEVRLDNLLNRLNVGVFNATSDGVLISANPAFFQLFGINPAIDPATFNLARLYPQEADHEQLIALLKSEGQVQDYHVRQRNLDGTLMWVSLSNVLVTDVKGNQHIDGLVEDITARKMAEAALMAKMEELARSNAELEEFAYVASHDLQEPLRMVSSYSSLLAGRYAQSLDEKGQSYLGQLIGGASRMQDLIRDILAFAKIGKLPNHALVDCNEVIEKTLFNLKEIIADSGAIITRDQLPTLIAEPVLLGQVFQNLIGNAIKFRHKERPATVHISVERSGAFWSFAVTDNGIGIPPQFYEKIFGVFQRLHSSDDYAGTGIGLAICRKAIQKHGGTITVNSVPEGGSVFRFLLSGNEPDQSLITKSA
jgi:PAS domain S-box-containing protein